MRMATRALLAQSMRENVRVTIFLCKNDLAWIDSGLPLKLVDSNDTSVSYQMTEMAGTNQYHADSIPDGTYLLYAPTTSGGSPVSTRGYFGTVSVSSEDVAKTLNYYSVTLNAGPGIIQSKLYGGIAWIIKGGLRNINASNAVAAGYQWLHWENADDGTVYSTAQSNVHISNISRQYTLTAIATPTS